jgi:hypothetical protein
LFLPDRYLRRRVVFPKANPKVTVVSNRDPAFAALPVDPALFLSAPKPMRASIWRGMT